MSLFGVGYLKPQFLKSSHFGHGMAPIVFWDTKCVSMGRDVFYHFPKT